MRRNERGAMAIEVAIVTPALVGAIMLIATGARYVDARGQVNQAAYAAARAASLTTNGEAAMQAGVKAAENSMADRGHACSHMIVNIDAGHFAPGGSVRATVTCRADLSDLVGFGLPGSKTFSFTAVVPLEEHRSLP
jgi:Flp pilus assembly protein TadG